MINNENKWRVSKSGYSIRTGLGDENKIIAIFNGQFSAENPEIFEQWLVNAELICDLYNNNSLQNTIETAIAFDVIKKAMIKDNPSKEGSYAHSWHCNIAMMCYDSIREATEEIPHEQALLIGNEAARRFMKLCFDVETNK